MTLTTDIGRPIAIAAAERGDRRRGGRLGVAVPVSLLILWLVAPLVPIVLWSFGRGWFFPAVLPDFSLAAWRYAASATSGMGGALVTSVTVSLTTSALSLAIGIPAGRALACHEFRGRTAVELLILAPAVVPGIAVAMGLHAVFLRLGLGGTLAGVVLVHLAPTLPYTVLVTASVFAGHDTAYEDQARTLGASPARVFRHVTVPMLAPGLAVAGAFAFLVSWSQYTLTLLIGGGQVVTLPLILTQFAGAGRNDVAGVAAILTILPGALVLLVTARHLARARPRRQRGRRR